MTVTLKSNHQAVKRQMHEDVADGQNRANEFLVTTAQANAPVKTGNLKSKIGVTKQASASSPSAESESGADYSVPVDQGTSDTAGTFYWTRAVIETMRRFPGFFKSRL